MSYVSTLVREQQLSPEEFDHIRAMVASEMAAFRAALPKLLTELPGKWVVFKGGEVQAVTDDKRAAYVRGIELFGWDGGHVVARVEQKQPIHLGSASLLFS